MSKRIVGSAAMFAFAAFASPAFACPEGQAEDSFGFCLPTIGGTVGDGFEHLKNEIRGQSLGGPLAAWLQASRDSSYGASQPIPPQIRAQLAGFISEDTLNRARFKVGDQGVFNAAANIMGVNGDVAAVTLIDVIVFRNGYDAGSNPVLWAHELTHVEQFANWGLGDFAISYTRNPSTVEGPAYQRESAYMAWRSQQARFSGPYPYPQPAGPARFCVTPAGTVPMAVAVPVGAPCGFNTPYGPASGIAQ